MTKNQGPVAGTSEAAELEALTLEKQAIYWEAIDCGATHSDAMEATTYSHVPGICSKCGWLDHRDHAARCPGAPA